MRDNNYSRDSRFSSSRSSAGRGTAAQDRRREGGSSYGRRDNSNSFGRRDENGSYGRDGQNRSFRKRDFGFSSEGRDENRNGFRKEGFRKEGSESRGGFRKEGFQRDGFRKEGYRSEGFRKDGFRKEGFEGSENRGGYRRDGFQRDGFRKNGFDGRGGNRPYKRNRPDYGHIEPKYSTSGTMEDLDGVRLNKFIANSGICSRREADDFIKAGLVTINGEVITEMGVKVKNGDDIRFNGERLKGEEKVYIVMNKPKDVVTTVSDPHAKMTVIDLIKNKCSKRVFPVGRLDKSTTGVLLLTNDGDLAEKLTHPSFEKKKIYHATLDKNVKGNDLVQLVEGITLEDGPISADEAAYVGEDKTQVGVEIHSGRNRIVRRMFEHLGYNVKKLDRVYFAGLTKRKLRRGEWRFLTEKEVGMLKMGSYE